MEKIESKLSNKSKELLYLLPKEVSAYITAITNTKSSDELDKIIDSLYRYYSNLYLTLHKIINAITPSDIDSISSENANAQTKNLYNSQIIHIADFQEYLVNNHLLLKKYITADNKLNSIKTNQILFSDELKLKPSERYKKIISYNNLIELADKVTSNPKYLEVITASLSGKRNSEIAKQIGVKSPSQIQQMLASYIRWCRQYTGLIFFTDKPPIPDPYK